MKFKINITQEDLEKFGVRSIQNAVNELLKYPYISAFNGSLYIQKYIKDSLHPIVCPGIKLEDQITKDVLARKPFSFDVELPDRYLKEGVLELNG